MDRGGVFFGERPPAFFCFFERTLLETIDMFKSMLKVAGGKKVGKVATVIYTK